jgi:hypothetical protein
MLSVDKYARFLWVQIHRKKPLLRDIYIAVCYFPPALSHFALHRESEEDPFSDLYADTFHYSTLGEVILPGNFNARTKNLKVSLHDKDKDVLCLQELEPESQGLHRSSRDRYGPLTSYGRHLLQLRESHDLLIMNGLPCFPSSGDFTCFPHSGEVCVVDYVLVNLDLLPYIQHFSISRLPLANHALLTFFLSTSPPSPAYTTPPHYLPL